LKARAGLISDDISGLRNRKRSNNLVKKSGRGVITSLKKSGEE
jgi:hypothetical protein